MITFLKGHIVELSPTHAVVDCNGVGYHLNISLNTFSKFENSATELKKFHTYLSIKEDAHTLYGFFDTKERECFILLLSVSGVGASTARMILSSLTPDELQTVILNEDVAALKAVKGIGLKSAQRIIIDLKDKVNIDASFTVQKPGNMQSTVKQEAIYALEKLGFPIKRTNKIIDNIICENVNLSVEEVIKLALKTL